MAVLLNVVVLNCLSVLKIGVGIGGKGTVRTLELECKDCIKDEDVLFPYIAVLISQPSQKHLYLK